MYSLGTTCAGADIVDDVQDEAVKRHIQEKVDSAVSAALNSQRRKADNAEVCVPQRHSEILLTCPVKQPKSSTTRNLMDRLGVASEQGDSEVGQRATRRSGRNK